MSKIERALSFGQAADLYDRVRPTYPAAAIRWAIGDQALRVVDLGAGTGILTRVLLGLGHDVVPVEPDPGMRRRLEAAVPGVSPQEGSAERIPLPASSTDAVVAGQAFHWFDQDRALPEIARVLRRPGTFAALWNIMDVRVGWVEHLARTAGLGDTEWLPEPRHFGLEDCGPLFTAPEHATFEFQATSTPENVLDSVRSRSSYLTASTERRSEIDTGVRELLQNHPDLAGRGSIDVPYVTSAFRSRLR